MARGPGGWGEGWGVSIIRLTGELTPFHSSQGALRSGLESKPKSLRATYITGILNPFWAQSLSVHYMHHPDKDLGFRNGR